MPEPALEALERDLRALNGMAAIRRTEFSRVDLDFVLGLDCYGAGRGEGEGAEAPLPFLQPPPACPDDEEHNHTHTAEVTTLALVEPIEVDLEALRHWLGSMLWQDDEGEVEGEGEGEGAEQGPHHEGGKRTEIYRIKGTLAVWGSEAVHILQAVHETFEVEPSRSLRFGDGDGGGGGRPRECRVVVIGRGLDEAVIRQGLRDAAAE